MQATHIMSNPKSGKLGKLNKDDDHEQNEVSQACPRLSASEKSTLNQSREMIRKLIT